MKTVYLFVLMLVFAFMPLQAQPDITNQPVSQTVWAGGNATFSVGVSGDGPFTYQWQLDSNNLPDGIITTVAGDGEKGFSGDGGPAIYAAVSPNGVALDNSGNFFVADVNSHRIRKVDTNGTITTIAGNGTTNYSGDGGPAIYAGLHPTALTVDASGNLFAVDLYNQRIRKVDTNGVITSVAGNGINGFFGDGSLATNASLYWPADVTVDTSGNLFIADKNNNRIRRVDTNGIITTVAGTGVGGYSGDGGEATNASLLIPEGVATDASGNLFIADAGNNRIRKVGTNSIIATVAGGSDGSDMSAATNASLLFPEGVAVDVSGNLIIADSGRWLVRKVDTNGIITTVAGNGSPGFSGGESGDGGAATNVNLGAPSSVAVDASGNLFIADPGNHRIRKVISTQGQTLVLNNVTATNAGRYQVVVTDASGSVTSSVANLTVYPIISQPASRTNVQGTTGIFSVDIGAVTPVTYQWFKDGLILTNGNNISGSTESTLTLTNVQDADAASYTVVVSNNLAGRMISSSASLTVIDWPVITNQPASQAVWAGGNVAFIVGASGTGPFTYQWQFDSNNLPNGIITTVAGNGINGFFGDGGMATNASLYWPAGVAVDAAGNLFIQDAGNNRIREVSANGIVKTVAGLGPSGNSGSFSGDGGPATNANFRLYYGSIYNTTPQASGVAVDPAGNLFISDYGNQRIRRVGTNGIITTIAGNGIYAYSGDGGSATNASLAVPCGIALDANGDLFLSDIGNQRIRKVDINGIISTVAGNGSQGPGPNLGDGGMATNATLYYPSGTTVDAAGNLFIADSLNARIRKVNSNGIITTVAGNNASGYFGDNVAATNTSLFDPLAVTVDAFGNLFIADTGNNRIRKVKSDGIITTVVGNGTPAYSGDGGAATNASLYHPVAAALDSGGNLFIADQANSRIRKVNNTRWPTLVLKDVNPANAGNYQVVVTGPAGSVTSSVAALDVGMITSQPASRANQAGSTATFSVTVQGMPLLSYQWLKNGSNLTEGSNISGSTTATLTLTNVQNADGALYSVVVSNSMAGCRTSSPALLTVIDIAAQPVPRSARPGNNVTFAVEVSGSGPLTYQWQLNGTNLPSGIITTVAGNGINGYFGDGGPAANASLSNPQSVSMDTFGNLFIVDTGNNRVREVGTNGIITTLAGTNGDLYFGDGGPAINAGLNQPTGAAVDASGNLFIADYGNNRIRQVDTNGIITTLAGTNAAGFSGDGDVALMLSYLIPKVWQ